MLADQTWKSHQVTQHYKRSCNTRGQIQPYRSQTLVLCSTVQVTFASEGRPPSQRGGDHVHRQLEVALEAFQRAYAPNARILNL